MVDDLAPLRVLAAVRDLGTVTEAGAVLGFSPSAVSQQLRRLSRQLGAPVTVRSGRNVALTPAAHELLDRAGPLLEQLDEVLHSLTTAADPVAGLVRVAAFTTAIRGGVPAALARLRDRHPRLSFGLAELDPEDAYRALGSGTADVAVVHHWDGQPPPAHAAVTARRMGRDPADVIARRDDPAVGLATLRDSLAGLAAANWVSTGRGTLCHSWLLTLFARAGTTPHITAELSDFTLHLDYVRAGLGLALIPRLGRPALPDDLVAIAPVDPPARIISVATRRSQGHDRAVQAVADELGGLLG